VKPKVRLPHVEPLGYAKLNFVKVDVRGGGMLNAHRDTGGDPVLYVDLEHSPHGTELHFGASGNFSLSPERPSSVKPHIDIYIPESEIHRLLQSIIQANLRRSNRPQAPVGPTSGPQYPPKIRYSADGGVSGQRETGRSGDGSGSRGMSSPPETSLAFSPSPTRPAATPQARPEKQRRGD